MRHLQISADLSLLSDIKESQIMRHFIYGIHFLEVTVFYKKKHRKKKTKKQAGFPS